MEKIVIAEYIDVKFINLYKASRGLSDLTIAKNSQKFDVPMNNTHVSRILNSGNNCELGTLIKLCYSSGMTPNDIVAGNWEAKDVESIKLQAVKLQSDNTILKEELRLVKKELVSYKRLEKFLKFKEVI